MTLPDAGNHIPWREWSEQAFRDARSQGKPVLLTMGATWCHWCHVMDQTAYSDDRVIRLVNSGFIPVRVDVDQRPDISLRYNQGTYPSVAFLTGDGEFLAGRPYTPADEMAALLEQISSGEFVPETQAAPGNTRSSANVGQGSSADAVMDQLLELYDNRFGGFGVEPKQPPWEALSFLAARYGLTGDRQTLSMVETTLQGMWHGIYDQKDQGFFRYSVSRDWKIPHYEKMLVSNANLLRAYLGAYQVTRRSIYKTACDGILDYLQSTLFDSHQGMFFASQDADEPFYLSSWKDRDASPAPPIDPTLYSGWNALAAHALIESGNVLGRSAYGRTGSEILEKLWNESWTDAGGLTRRVGVSHDATPVLIDQVYFINAWLALYQSTGQPEPLSRAMQAASTVQQLFSAPRGGCYDTIAPQSFESGILRREQPVLDNSLWAESLLSLAHLTGDDKYRRSARETLSIFESVVPGKTYVGDHASRRMEEDEEALFLPAGAAWGRAMDFLTRGPVSLVLVGDSTSPEYRRLHRSALRVHAPHRIVQPLDVERDGEQIRTLGFPPDSGPALYACMGIQCLAPISTPDGVRVMARSRAWMNL